MMAITCLDVLTGGLEYRNGGKGESCRHDSQEKDTAEEKSVEVGHIFNSLLFNIKLLIIHQTLSLNLLHDQK